jgi:hypothetical protein
LTHHYGNDPWKQNHSNQKEPAVLTRRHLAVIRAALGYFAEELGPHGADAFGPYLDEPLTEGLTTVEIEQLRRIIQQCELRYVCCDRAATGLVGHELFRAVEEARSSALGLDDTAVVATVLVPTGTA